MARIEEIEREVQHDVIAFVSAVAENVGPEGRWLHYGLTSSDVVDTALAMVMRDAVGLILGDVDRLMEVVARRAFEYKDAPMIGRTHGVHAEPMTFGLKLANWYAELQRRSNSVSAVYLSHILIKLPENPTEQQIAAAREKAAQAIQRIKGGEAFAEVAKQVSRTISFGDIL